MMILITSIELYRTFTVTFFYNFILILIVLVLVVVVIVMTTIGDMNLVLHNCQKGTKF